MIKTKLIVKSPFDFNDPIDKQINSFINDLENTALFDYLINIEFSTCVVNEFPVQCALIVWQSKEVKDEYKI